MPTQQTRQTQLAVAQWPAAGTRGPTGGLTPAARRTLRTFLWSLPFLLTGLCFWQALPGARSASQPTATASVLPAAPATKRTLVTRPIQDIRPGMRVLAENPELKGQDVPQIEIDPENTRLVSLHMVKPDGHELTIETLMPVELLFSAAIDRQMQISRPADNREPELAIESIQAWSLNDALAGHVVELNLADLGVDGPARVTSVNRCPTIEPDDGTGRRLVTSVFRHAAANVVDLTTSGSDQSIGVTANHPFWSEDRQEFVPAGELRTGENLRNADGTLTQVTRITPRRGPPVPVFNFEVDGQHVYSVGADGLLVHNACAYHPNDARSTLVNHGYVIFNKFTKEIYKVGISAAKLLANGDSPRALAQYARIAASNGVSIDAIDHAVSNTKLLGRTAALIWENRLVGFLRSKGNALINNLRPLGF